MNCAVPAFLSGLSGRGASLAGSRRATMAALLISVTTSGCGAEFFDHILPQRNQQPIASFTVTSKVAVGSRELKVTFDASGSLDDSEIRDYIWDFGNASAVQTLRGDAGRKPVYPYLVANTAVTVKLLVRDDDGELSEPASARVLLALNRPPVASFSPTQAVGKAPFVVTFTSSSSDQDPNETALLEHRWQFEEGGPVVSSRAFSIEHRYANPGLFPVTLRVSDGLEESTPVFGEVRVE